MNMREWSTITSYSENTIKFSYDVTLNTFTRDYISKLSKIRVQIVKLLDDKERIKGQLSWLLYANKKKIGVNKNYTERMTNNEHVQYVV